MKKLLWNLLSLIFMLLQTPSSRAMESEDDDTTSTAITHKKKSQQGENIEMEILNFQIALNTINMYEKMMLSCEKKEKLIREKIIECQKRVETMSEKCKKELEERGLLESFKIKLKLISNNN